MHLLLLLRRAALRLLARQAQAPKRRTRQRFADSQMGVHLPRVLFSPSRAQFAAALGRQGGWVGRQAAAPGPAAPFECGAVSAGGRLPCALTVGIPAFILVVLWRVARPSALRATDAATRERNAARFGVLFDSYDEGSWWWELVEFTRKLLLTSVVIFISPGGVTPERVCTWGGGQRTLPTKGACMSPAGQRQRTW